MLRTSVAGGAQLVYVISIRFPRVAQLVRASSLYLEGPTFESWHADMKYRGIIIEESLENNNILKTLKILSTKIKLATEKHKTPWVKQWTLHTVEIPEESAQEIAEKLSSSLDKNYSWYADYKNDSYHFIVYRNKIFKVDLKNPILYRDAKKYGISLGIPEYQVDFAPEDQKFVS